MSGAFSETFFFHVDLGIAEKRRRPPRIGRDSLWHCSFMSHQRPSVGTVRAMPAAPARPPARRLDVSPGSRISLGRRGKFSFDVVPKDLAVRPGTLGDARRLS